MNFKVLKNLKHNGVVYTPGQEVVLTEDESASLVADGVLEKIVPKVSATKASVEIEKPKKRGRKRKK